MTSSSTPGNLLTELTFTAPRATMLRLILSSEDKISWLVTWTQDPTSHYGSVDADLYDNDDFVLVEFGETR